MVKFRSGKHRLLYLLALAQLVGGPLVLLNVMLFAKLTIQETPRVGIAQAVAEAWHSPVLQESIAALPWKGSLKPEKHDGKLKPKPDFPSPPSFPWIAGPQEDSEHAAVCGVPDHLRTWTPLWPHAPPGPPPRIG